MRSDDEPPSSNHQSPPLFLTLSEWQSQTLPSSNHSLIDVRSHQDFSTIRLRGSASFPVDDLHDLLFELPEPSTPLFLLGNHDALEAARTLLHSRGWKLAGMILVEDDKLWWQEAKSKGVAGKKFSF